MEINLHVKSQFQASFLRASQSFPISPETKSHLANMLMSRTLAQLT